MSRLLRNIFMFVVYAYLYIPIIILVTNSFNEDRYGLSWKGFSWNWYERLFNNDTLIQAAFHSVTDRKSTRLNSSHSAKSRMPSSA